MTESSIQSSSSSHTRLPQSSSSSSHTRLSQSSSSNLRRRRCGRCVVHVGLMLCTLRWSSLSLRSSYTALHTSCTLMWSHLVFICMFCPFDHCVVCSSDCPIWCLPTLLCIIGMISFQDNIRSKHIRLDLCNYNNLLIFEIEISLSGFLHHDITESGVKIQIKYLITI